MKKILALILALTMLMTFAAAAETDEDETEETDLESYIGYLTLLDASFVIDDETIDLSGLLAAFNLAVTDTELSALAAQLYNASSYKLLFYAAAQLDENGLTLYSDDISDLYTFSTDWLIENGFDPADVAEAALYTAISEPETFTDEDRLDALEAFFASVSDSAEETDSGTVYTFDLDSDACAALLDSLSESLDDSLDYEDLFEDLALAFSGTATRRETVLTANLSGTLTDTSDGTQLPFEVEIIDASTAVEVDLIFTDSEDPETDLTIIYTESPSLETDEIDYEIVVSSGEETLADLLVQTAFLDEADTSIIAQLDISGETILKVNYAGVTDSEGDEIWQDGAISFSYYGDSTISFYTDVIIGYMPSTSSQWTQDTDTHIDADSLDEEQQEALEEELSAALEDLIEAILDIAPDLEPYLGDLL